MKTDLKKEIKKGSVVVLVIPNEQYTAMIKDVSVYFGNNHKSICYVSLNKIFDALCASLKKSKINLKKFLFIDAITKAADPSVKEADNCVYISSSSSLTKMSIAITKVLGTGKIDGLLFDSLSTLLIYNKPGVVSKFVHSLMTKIKKSNTTAVFTALEGDTNSALLKEVGLYVDKVIHCK